MTVPPGGPADGLRGGVVAAVTERRVATLPDPPAWPRPARPWTGPADLLLGARLARGANRSGRWRMVLTAAVIGVTVTLLLFAASVGHVRAAQQRRDIATYYIPGDPIPGVDPLYILERREPYGGHDIRLTYVRSGGPRTPVPPGLARLPSAGEQVVSPALARLLASPAGAPYRVRYPARTVGTIGPDGLPGGPGELALWVGSADLGLDTTFRFGRAELPPAPLPPLLWALLVVGVVVLLVPMVVLVAAVSRLSAADRRRRLAAVRLVGAGAGQVRRIAAGEVLAGALLGLPAGTVLFLALRELVDNDAVRGASVFAGVRPFPADVVPSWPLVVLIAVALPGLAVLTAVLALRRTLIEPLGAVRQAAPERVRLLRRLVPAAAGTGLLIAADVAAAGHGNSPAGRFGTGPVLGAGTALILLSVPLVLPWLVQRVVRRPRDETPALQLAARRLQLDGGPAARLAAGVAVTLAGAIGLSALLAAAQDRFDPGPQPRVDRATIALVPPVDGAALAGTLRALPGVTAAERVDDLTLSPDGSRAVSAVVAPCPALTALTGLRSCVDGEIYGSAGFDLGPSARVMAPDGQPTRYTVRFPAVVRPGGPGPGLLVTPGAVRSLPAGLTRPRLQLRLDGGDPGAVDRVRTALTPAGWHADLETRFEFGVRDAQSARDFVAIRRALFAAALLTLTLAAVALLVLCLQQVRDSRRPFAALAAAGVPRAVLARSMLWQNAILAAIALLLADVVGVALGALLLPLAESGVRVDWPAVATLTAAALGTVALTTLLTLPAVRAATHPGGLRTE